MDNDEKFTRFMQKVQTRSKVDTILDEEDKIKQEKIMRNARLYKESKKSVVNLSLNIPNTLETICKRYDQDISSIKLNHAGVILMFDPNVLFTNDSVITFKHLLTKVYLALNSAMRTGVNKNDIQYNDGFLYFLSENIENPLLKNSSIVGNIMYYKTDEIADFAKDSQSDHLYYDRYIKYMINNCTKNLQSFVFSSNPEVKPHVIFRGYVYKTIPNMWSTSISDAEKSTYCAIRDIFKSEYEASTMRLYNAIASYEYIFNNRKPMFIASDTNLVV